MRKILIVAFREIRKGKRVLRQLEYLKEKYEVYAVGFDQQFVMPEIQYVRVTPRFKSTSLFQRLIIATLLGGHKFSAAYPRMYDLDPALRYLSDIGFDLILAHDLKPLPFIERLDKLPTLLVDVHEYFFDKGEKESLRSAGIGNYFIYKLLENFDQYLIKRYFPVCEHCFTVSQGIAEQYEKKMGRRFEVITSAHDYVHCTPSLVSPDKIRLIHHGYASRTRKIERMIEMMDAVDERFTLDLMLTSLTFEHSYIDYLAQLAASRNNVRIIPPVAPDDIVTYTNQYDIGIFLLPETNLSLKYALPNKFFEFIQARLCIAIGPSIEMARIVKQYDLGIVAEDFQSSTLAQKLNALTSEQIMHHKQQCHRHARELSSETEMEKLGSMIAKLLLK